MAKPASHLLDAFQLWAIIATCHFVIIIYISFFGPALIIHLPHLNPGNFRGNWGNTSHTVKSDPFCEGGGWSASDLWPSPSSTGSPKKIDVTYIWLWLIVGCCEADKFSRCLKDDRPRLVVCQLQEIWLILNQQQKKLTCMSQTHFAKIHLSSIARVTPVKSIGIITHQGHISQVSE